MINVMIKKERENVEGRKEYFKELMKEGERDSQMIKGILNLM